MLLKVKIYPNIIVNSNYQTVELFPFEIKTTLNNKLNKTFYGICFLGWECKTNFAETKFRRFANKLQNCLKLIEIKINLAKVKLVQDNLFPAGNKGNPSGHTT